MKSVEEIDAELEAMLAKRRELLEERERALTAPASTKAKAKAKKKETTPELAPEAPAPPQRPTAPAKLAYGYETRLLEKACVHLGTPGKGERAGRAWYPVLNIGLPKPFAFLNELCDECVKKETVESFLTDEVWDRLVALLRKNGEPIPERSSVTMEFRKAITYTDPHGYNDYSYAMAA